MKRVAVTAAVVLAALAAIMVTPAGVGADRFVKIRFGSDGVSLVVPTPPPACRTTHGTVSCRWELLVTEEGLGVVGAATGTSGILRVAYPTTCGVIHANALVGPPTRREVGYAHTIAAPCTPPPPAPVGLDVADSALAPPVPLTQSPSTRLPTSATLAPAANPSALAFTGAPMLDLLVVGLICLLVSAWCLVPVLRRHRRYVRYWNSQAGGLMRR